MTINTINRLESHLTQEQVREVRLKTLEGCSQEDAIKKGMLYVADLMIIYRENLRTYENGEDRE